MNYCEKNPNTCGNGGKCTSLTKDDGLYTCECPAGYRGENCDRTTMTTTTASTVAATVQSTSKIEIITPMSYYNNSVEPLLSARNTTISTVDTTTAVTTSSTEYNDDENET